MAPRETEDNAYANFWSDKQRASWYSMVFSGVVNSVVSFFFLSAPFLMLFIVVRKVIECLSNRFCSNLNVMLQACLLVIPNRIIFHRQYCIERLMFVLSPKHFIEG